MGPRECGVATVRMDGRRHEKVRTVTIEGLDQEGRGVGRHQGRPILLHGALPGETIRYHRLSRKRSHDEGVVDTIDTPSPERVDPRCAHFGTCGGCSLQHLDSESQIDLKAQWLLDRLKRIGRVEPEHVLAPLRGPLWGYRRKARLAVKYDGRKGRVLVGFRERNSPRVADIRRCEVLHPDAGGLIESLSVLVGRLSIRRCVPQIEVAFGDDERAFCFRVLDKPSQADLAALRAFGSEHEAMVFLQADRAGGMRSLADRDNALYYRLADYGLRMAFSPSHFIQVNAEVNRAMVALALDLLNLRQTDHLLDLFCGLGNFTLPLATRAASVVGVDGDSALIGWAEQNAVFNSSSNVSFHTADLTADPTDTAWMRRTYDGILLDPPRTGALEMMPHLAGLDAARILYVSCDPRTLARDVGFLVHEQGYTLDKVGVMDMFPHTSHVESIALLRRT